MLVLFLLFNGMDVCNTLILFIIMWVHDICLYVWCEVVWSWRCWLESMKHAKVDEGFQVNDIMEWTEYAEWGEPPTLVWESRSVKLLTSTIQSNHNMQQRKALLKVAVTKQLEAVLSLSVFAVIETQNWMYLMRMYPLKISLDHFSSLWPSLSKW